jgi:hypothetical protein
MRRLSSLASALDALIETLASAALHLSPRLGSRAASPWRGLARLSLALMFAVGTWAAAAQAKTAVHSLTGNARFQIGNGLPIPIGFTAAPAGKVKAVPGAFVMQTTGPDPKQMTIPAGQLTAPAVPFVLGLPGFGSALGQVYTAVAVSLPGAGLGAVLKAGGRTGPATVTFCPGVPLGSPCTGPGAGPGINGLVRYTKTAAQFGGAVQGRFGGTANIAILAGGVAPGTVTVIFALARPPATGAQGGPFGFRTTDSGPAPEPPNAVGIFYANGNGTLIGPPIWQHPTAYGVPNPMTSYGVPWTTGRITISVTAALGPDEIFTFTGSDNRVNGVGSISLVAGGVSERGVSGPNGNRGWLNLTVGPRTGLVPAISGRGLLAVVGLLALAGGYALRRRTRDSAKEAGA